MDSTKYNDVQEFILEKLKTTLNIEEVDENLSFYDHGGDSLTFVIFVSEVLNQFDQDLSDIKLSGIQPLGQIFSLFNTSSQSSNSHHESLSINEDKINNGNILESYIPVTANRYSYLLKMNSGIEQWIVHSPVYEFSKKITSENLSAAYNLVQQKFDGLRLKVEYSDGKFEQYFSDDNAKIVEISIDQSFTNSQIKDSIIEYIKNLRQQLSLSNNMILLLVNDNVNKKSYVVLVFHHILLDSVSLREVEKELIDLLVTNRESFFNNNRIVKSYREYCSEYIQRCEKLAHNSSSYWSSLPWPYVRSTPLDFEENGVHLSHDWTKECKLEFDGHKFDLAVKALAKNSNMSISNIVLVALSKAYSKWSGLEYMLLDLAHHGRVAEQGMVDFAKTVGWINETVPIIFNTKLSDLDLIRETKEQLTRMSVEASLFNYCKYLSKNTTISKQFSSYPNADISLNIELTHSESKIIPSTVKIHSWSVEKGIGNRVHQIAGGVVRKNESFFLQLDYNSTTFKEGRVEDLLELWGSEFVSLLNQFSKVNLIGA